MNTFATLAAGFVLLLVAQFSAVDAIKFFKYRDPLMGTIMAFIGGLMLVIIYRVIVPRLLECQV